MTPIRDRISRLGRCVALAVLAIGLAGAGLTANAASAATVVFPAHVAQGAMVIGRVPPDSRVTYAGRRLRVTDYGTVVFGIARDAKGPARVEVRVPGESAQTVDIRVTAHDWPAQRVDGVPPKTVSPPAEIARRIDAEQGRVAAARQTSDDGLGFAEHFIRPASGPVSGHFGSQRVYNGTPGSAHSGMDIAAAAGTPVVAPASGTVVFVDRDLYLTGGTVLLDHGHGIGSNFLHLSRIDVAKGETVAQGQTLGAVGSSGRATGPHLHWGMTWYNVRIDPEQVLAR
ncbi:M23 family metallopeptidase [uncultured Salinisphaera sp.]|uniref:M23 family metallopeptidase n=1 Tax=uncultured Salinisphaera sp. TaxID=359372 RepID=UPI0032B15A06|tara:strand:- start:6816 stop:7670 length:855 start_codon:yes stop_codon:yes gene_type:complete